MRAILRIANLLIAGFLLTAATLPVQAQRASRKAILVVADGITMEDLQEPDLPRLSELVRGGSLGLVAPCSAGRKTPESVFASIGAGEHSRGSSALNEACSANEVVVGEHARAAEVYARRTGVGAESGQVLLISIGKVIRTNEDAGYRVRLGELGEALRRAGLQAAIFGNSDIGDRCRRFSAAIIMDNHGVVPIGDVSSRMLTEGSSPTGKVSNVIKLAASVDEALSQAAFVVVDFGDTARLDSAEASLTPEAYAQYRQQALKNLDLLIDKLLPVVRRERARLIFASFVPPGRREWPQLTPIVIYGPDVPHGLLSSATTRTPGLVAGIDLAPYVLETVGVRVPYHMMGRPIRKSDNSNPAAALERLAALVNRNQRVQAPLLAPVAALGILAMTAAAALVAFRAMPSRGVLTIVRSALVFVMSVPLGALLFSKAAPMSPGKYAAVVLVASIVLTAAAFAGAAVVAKIKGQTWSSGALPMVILAAMMATAAIVDAIRGGSLARLSALPSFGFRFYGIGNEYMGLTVGSLAVLAIWFSGPRFSLAAKKVFFGIFSISVLAIGYPGFGTNAGGAITAVVTLGLLYIACSRGGFKLRHVAALLCAAIALLLVFAAVDLAVNGRGASHIGVSLAATQRDGAGYLAATAARKMGMNFRQVGTRQGRLALMGAMPLAVLWFLGIRPKMMDNMKGWQDGQIAGLFAVLVGTGAAFISNDNGVLAGFLLLAPVVSALFLSLTGESIAQDNGP